MQLLVVIAKCFSNIVMILAGYPPLIGGARTLRNNLILVEILGISHCNLLPQITALVDGVFMLGYFPGGVWGCHGRESRLGWFGEAGFIMLFGGFLHVYSIPGTAKSKLIWSMLLRLVVSEMRRGVILSLSLFDGGAGVHQHVQIDQPLEENR